MPEAGNMGRRLAYARASKGKILFHTSVRLTLAGIVVLAGIRGNPPKGGPASFWAGLLVVFIVLAALAWVFFPLIHCKDRLEFYEAGIVIGRKSWALEELGRISFMDIKSNFSMFGQTYMCTEARKFNVTYIKDAKKNFNRAYFNEI